MIHLANGGNNDLYHTVFDGLTAKGVEYDVIGLVLLQLLAWADSGSDQQHERDQCTL